jgi:hypothetical protein
MNKPFIDQETGIEWYVNENPVEKYLKIDRIHNQMASKFVSLNSEKHLPRKKIKQIHKHRMVASSI